jgi:hypothetical protein
MYACLSYGRFSPGMRNKRYTASSERYISYPRIFSLVSDHVFAGTGCKVLRLTAVRISTRRLAYTR